MITPPSPARDLSMRLSGVALAVCQTYFSNGRRSGRYWSVGDVHNNPGQSLYIRLTGPTSGRGAAGHWTDAATGEHGDLLDLLRAHLGLTSLAETLDEARRFLSLPGPKLNPAVTGGCNSVAAARRLFASGRPVPGTWAERYLRARGITAALDLQPLRYHPKLYCHEAGWRRTFPALLAAVTDPSGHVTGVERTWLDPHRPVKARLRAPRRALGSLLGNGVWLGEVSQTDRSCPSVLLVGEGIETVLSLRSALPRLPMIAGLSAHHLAALNLPSALQRLYIARDRDRAGERAARRLRDRAEAVGIEVVDLVPAGGDFNSDLRRFSGSSFRARVLRQLKPEDAERFGNGRATGQWAERAAQRGRAGRS